MVKVRGPLMSGAAMGTIGKLLTFQRAYRGTKCYPYKKHIDAESSLQLAHRAKFSEALGDWLALSPESKEEWNDAAKYMPMTGFNYFMSRFFSCGGSDIVWYELYGPTGTAQVLRMGDMFVPLNQYSPGAGLKDSYTWAAADLYRTNLNWLNRSDWRIPTGNVGGEMAEICTHKAEFDAEIYAQFWSSTEFSSTKMYSLAFANCVNYKTAKTSSLRLLCVRSAV